VAEIRFCTAPDGVRLAYAMHGRGPPLVRVATWLTHRRVVGCDRRGLRSARRRALPASGGRL